MKKYILLVLVISSISAFALGKEPYKKIVASPASYLTFSQDGETIITADGKEGTVSFWDVKSGKRKKFLKAQKYAYFVTVSPNGKHVLTHGDADISLWDIEGYRLLWSRTEVHGIDYHYNNSIVFSPDGAKIAFVMGYITVLDAVSGQTLFELKLKDAKDAFVLDFLPDSNTILFVEKRFNNNTVNSLDLSSKTAQQKFSLEKGEGIMAEALSYDKKYMALGVFRGRSKKPNAIYVYDVQTCKRVHVLESDESKKGGYSLFLDFSPDGKFLAEFFASKYPVVLLWDLEKEQDIMVLKSKVKLYDWTMPRYYPKHSNAAFSKDGKFLAVSENENILVWDVSKLLSDTTDTTKPQEGK